MLWPGVLICKMRSEPERSTSSLVNWDCSERSMGSDSVRVVLARFLAVQLSQNVQCQRSRGDNPAHLPRLWQIYLT